MVICMPTEHKALVDLLLYLEQNFSVLPQEFHGRSPAFDLLRTMPPQICGLRENVMKRRRRSVRKRNRQRLACHARRLRR